MGTEKKVIKIYYSVWANYYEGWPVFELHDTLREGSGDIKVELTKDEIKDYEEIERRYFEWQKKIKEMAFPTLENY